MAKKLSNVFEDLLITSGIGVSLVDIQNILSIILLCFNILWIIYKIIMKIIKYSKDGELSKEEIEDIENDISELNKKGK